MVWECSVGHTGCELVSLSMKSTSPRDFIGRLGWELGSSHLGGRTRHGSDAQGEFTSYLLTLPSSQGLHPGTLAYPLTPGPQPALMPVPSSSESINERSRGTANTVLVAYPRSFPLQSREGERPTCVALWDGPKSACPPSA